MGNRFCVPGNAALLLVDVQEGLDELPYWGDERNNPDAEVRISRLLAA